MISNSVGDAIKGETVVRLKTELQLGRKNQRAEKIHGLLTAAPFACEGNTYALLIIEDITEVMERRRILPMCASGRRIRDDKEYWEHVESYLSKHWDVRFSHSIRPECAKRLCPDFFRAQCLS
jgi:hypothetical protein